MKKQKHNLPGYGFSVGIIEFLILYIRIPRIVGTKGAVGNPGTATTIIIKIILIFNNNNDNNNINNNIIIRHVGMQALARAGGFYSLALASTCSTLPSS